MLRMMRRTLPILMTVLPAALPLRAQVIDPPSPTYTLSPNPATAGSAFVLHLYSSQFQCGSMFTHDTATVAGSRIDLVYSESNLAVGAAAIVCPVGPILNAQAAAIPLPIYQYGPAFNMPALKAGSYQVYATSVPACVYSQPACKIVQPVPSLVGTLVVDPQPTKDGWFLKDKEVTANKAFTMQLLNKLYGSCQTTFTHATATVNTTQGAALAGPGIYTTFTIQTDTSKLCVMNTTPWGPSFSIDAQKPGRYPVYVSVMPSCVYNAIPCPIAVMLPQVVDTLVVSAVSGISFTGLHGNEGFSVESVEGNRISLSLPKGSSGLWHADLLTVSGKQIQSFAIAGEGGARVNLDVTAKPEPGLYLLRLVSPTQETRALPIAW